MASYLKIYLKNPPHFKLRYTQKNTLYQNSKLYDNKKEEIMI